jgi:hypothetical protein
LLVDVDVIQLKALSREMDPAEIRFIRKAFFKERGAKSALLSVVYFEG